MGKWEKPFDWGVKGEFKFTQEATERLKMRMMFRNYTDHLKSFAIASIRRQWQEREEIEYFSGCLMHKIIIIFAPPPLCY